MEKQKLPDTELKVMQAIWHIEPPASTSAVREELQKERPGIIRFADPSGQTGAPWLFADGEAGQKPLLYPPRHRGGLSRGG